MSSTQLHTETGSIEKQATGLSKSPPPRPTLLRPLIGNSEVTAQSRSNARFAANSLGSCVPVEDVALEGHTATDIDGRPLIELDQAAEARLRWKLDLRLVPMISLLYLFCFSKPRYLLLLQLQSSTL